MAQQCFGWSMARSKSSVSIDLSGLLKIPAQVEREVNAELRKIGLDALGESIRRAPVDEGTLRGSHSMHLGGERVATGVEMGAQMEGGADPTPLEGGADTDRLNVRIVANTVYAAAQHEGVEFAHPKGGEAKWMERVVSENRAQYQRALARAAKRGVEGQ